MNEGPAATITKYAVVRAARAPSTLARPWRHVQPMRTGSGFWAKVKEIIAAGTNPSQLRELCISFIRESDVAAIGTSPVAGFLSRSREALDHVSEAIRTTSYLDLKTELTALLNEFLSIENKVQAEELETKLWDYLAATLILNSAPAVPEVVDALKIISIGRFLSGSEGMNDISPADLTPDILVDEELLAAIIFSQRDLREASRAAAEKSEAERLAAVKGRLFAYVAASSALVFVETAIRNRTLITHGTLVPKTALGGAGESISYLDAGDYVDAIDPAFVASLNKEIVNFLGDEMGVNDLAAVSAIKLQAQLRDHLTTLSRSLFSHDSPSFMYQSQERLRTIADRFVHKGADIDVELTLLAKSTGTSGLSAPPIQMPFPLPSIRPAGIGDLKIVRQQLSRYELGEVAYIENILAGEERERLHNRLDRTEQQVLIETEESTSTEHDLQSTERFELSQELENVHKETKSTDTGVSVTASYGAVSLSAHSNSQSNQSAELAEKNARKSVKESVDRAVQRIQKRVRRQQTVTTTVEVTESNKHRFVATKESVVGVYRWVEKHYWCQTFNYGARMMMEFIVPEPAAFYMFSQTSAPGSDINLIPPTEPTYSAEDLTDQNYREFAAVYQASVTDPPPVFKYSEVFHLSKKDQDGSGAERKLTLPDGYEVLSAKALGSWVHISTDTDAALIVYVGHTEWDTRSWPYERYFSPPLRREVTARVQVFKISEWTVGLTFLMVRTEESFQAWQLKTYESILGAYNQQRSDYEKRLNAARPKAYGQVERPDSEYRNIERQELRRASLELLTNQHFDMFGAMTVVSGVPTMDNARALFEGRIVQFFEQGFEWNDMVYVFYPYYWGRKSSWTASITRSDVDPVFSRFLNAGYARVVVPIRPQFERDISYYIKTGYIKDDAPLIGDPDYVSIIDEIKAIDDALSSESAEGRPEGDPWRVTLPTPLVCLEKDGLKLPSWDITAPATGPFEPSEATCDGVPYNVLEWPDKLSVAKELKQLGYESVITNEDAAGRFLLSAKGRRVVREFQRRANELGVASVIGRPLRLDSVAGPCTLRALSVMAARRRLNNWPGPR